MRWLEHSGPKMKILEELYGAVVWEVVELVHGGGMGRQTVKAVVVRHP